MELESTPSLFSATSSNQAASFTKAHYIKPNLLEVAKHDGANLIPMQQAMLFNVLTANNKVFQGGWGHYTGPLVGLKLKDDAKPWQAKQYPIPLKNREVHKLIWQCSIRAFYYLTPEESEEREWAFLAFGLKKNGNVQFVIDFRCINQNLICQEHPLWTTEDILTSSKGFIYVTSLNLNMGYP